MVVPVILVKRGDCTFTHKVRHIEKAGASAGLIEDSRVEVTEKIVMADDGSGDSIHIPSFLIRKDVGDLVKKFARKAEPPVIVKVSTDIHVSTASKQ